MVFRTHCLRKSLIRELSLLLALGGSIAKAQSGVSTTPEQWPPASHASEGPSGQQTAPSKPWIVRDPATGRVFQQQLVSVNVPVTRWEPRTIEQTVYEPRITTQIQQIPQTTYTPSTQNVLQPKVTGWWNPFKQPVQSYKSVPVTHWLPQTQQVANRVNVQQWVPRKQKIVVYQKVQATEIRQQLVQTELPQPLASPTVIAAAPTPKQPWIRLPILAQQRILPWAGSSTPGVYSNAYPTYAATAQAMSTVAQPPAVPSSWQPAGQPASQTALANAPVPLTPITTAPQFATSGLRPVANPRIPLVLPPLSFPRFAGGTYSAPLQTSTSLNTTASRDALQSGMQPTVLR